MSDPRAAVRAWSIRARLLLLVFVVWLPAAAGFAVLAWSTYAHEERAARQRVQELADTLNMTAERELDKRVFMARGLAASRALRDGDVARFHAAATMAAAGSGSWVLLVDRERQLANTLLQQPRTIERRGAPFVTGQPEVFFNPRGAVAGRPVLAVFAPQPGGEVRYNVGVAMDPGVLQAIFDRRTLPQGVLASLVDRDLRVMARSRDAARWIGTEATGDVRRRLAQRLSGFAPSVTLDGVPSLTYVSPPNRHGWHVVMALPQSALTASARALTLQASLAAALLLLAALLLAWYAARAIGRPIGALAQAAAALGRNEIPAPLATGVVEADAVGRVLHDAGTRLHDAGCELQRRIEEAVQEARAAEMRLMEAQKHETIGRLTGQIAHDFNNLLQTISMGLQVVERSVPAGGHARALRAAMGACTRAADLVRQMLAFGRSQPLQPQAVGLGDFLLKHQELTRRAVGERIALHAEVAPGLPPVHADPTQLELALLNLVFNARDAMPQGGRITLRARAPRPAEVQGLEGPAFVAVEVEDDGPGMDASTRARVFEPYFTTKPVGTGTGLGLPQVRAFAQRSGGQVVLASAPGVGTCVTLVLPASAAAPVAPGQAAEAAGCGRPLRLLMVEDDALVAGVVVPALESTGHAVTLCASADEARALLRDRCDFDVLFTDVVMPGALSGLDLVAWCRERHPGLPAVVATGYTAQAIAPDIAVLRKPYRVEEVLAALDAAAVQC